MVRNAGSMCITKNILLRIVQYITVQPTYVCYCTLAPSPTYIRHILLGEGGRDIEQDSE